MTGIRVWIDCEIIDGSLIIWRFLDLAKYISLLKERALYLTQADKFEDQFEGAVCPLADAGEEI